MSTHGICNCFECRKFNRHHHHHDCGCDNRFGRRVFIHDHLNAFKLCSHCGNHHSRCTCHHSHHDCHLCHHDHHHSHSSCNFPHSHHSSIIDKRFIFDDKILCDDRFRLRLGGLQRGMAFRLRQLLGCKVKFEVEKADDVEKIVGRVEFVGTDFVEVHIVKKDKDDDNKKQHKKHDFKEKFRIIPFDSIKWMELKDDDCVCGCGC